MHNRHTFARAGDSSGILSGSYSKLFPGSYVCVMLTSSAVSVAFSTHGACAFFFALLREPDGISAFVGRDSVIGVRFALSLTPCFVSC